jgi:NADH-quinone oxidoreductase subunit E
MDKGIGTILDRYPQGDCGFLIPILQEVHGSQGYLSPRAVDQIAEFTGVPPGEIFGVASFYAQFRFTRPGKHTVRVCLGTACHVRGGDRLLDFLERQLKIKPGGTTSDGQFSLERVACFGCCALAPVVVLGDTVHARMTAAKAQRLHKKYGA